MQKQTSLRIFGNIKKIATYITMKSLKHASLWNVDSKKTIRNYAIHLPFSSMP